MADKRACVFCGKLFEVCSVCDRQVVQYKVLYGGEPWRTICDSAACYQAYETVRKYGFGDIDAKTAKARLSRIVDLPDLSLRPATQKAVAEIMAYTEPKAAPELTGPKHKTETKAATKQAEQTKTEKKPDKAAK